MDGCGFVSGRAIENEPDAAVDFANSWRQSRTFGGDRFHEGCDIMASVNQRGIYPIYSVSDGVVENIGWLRLAVTALESGAGMALIFIMHISRIMQKISRLEKK